MPLAAQGVIVDEYKPDVVETKIAAVQKERGLIHRDEDELSVAAKGSALSAILAFVAKP